MRLRHVGLLRNRSDHVEPLRRGTSGARARPRRCSRRSAAAIPTALAELKRGRDRARSRLRRRHRRAAVGQARRPDRQGLRPRHDRRDAGARAREPARRPASTNVEFLKGEIEHIPLPDNSVDVIISNCVINLSADKDARAARGVPRAEARRPLRRLRRRRPRRGAGRRPARAWSCGSAASPARSRSGSTASKLARAGFEEVDVEPTRVYQVADARQFLTEAGFDERRARADRRPVHERLRPRAEAAIAGGRKGMLLVHVLRLSAKAARDDGDATRGTPLRNPWPIREKVVTLCP